MLKDLVYIADRMDRLGFYRVASNIDSCIRKIANDDTTVAYDNVERTLISNDLNTIANEGLPKVQEIIDTVDEKALKTDLSNRWDYGPEDIAKDPYFHHIQKKLEANQEKDKVEEFVQGASAIISLEYHNLRKDIKDKYFSNKDSFYSYLGELGESIYKINYIRLRANQQKGKRV